MLLKSFLAITMLMSADLYASGEVGNGGNAVVCYTNNTKKEIRSIELFDYWEMSQLNPNFGGIDLGGENLNYKQKIEFFVNKIAKFDPVLSKKVGTIALSMANNIDYYLTATNNIPTANDDNSNVRPIKPCYKEPFAIQWKDPSSGSRRFTIKESLFNHPMTSEDDKAGIILHESLYRVAILNGSSTSDAIRYFNFVVASEKFRTLFKNDYIQLLINTNLASLQGCAIQITRVGKIFATKEARSMGGFNYRLCMPMTFKDSKIDVVINEGVFIDFGRMTEFQIVNGKAFLFKGTENQAVSNEENAMIEYFLDSKNITAVRGFDIKIKVGSHKLACDSHEKSEIIDDGSLRSCQIAEDKDILIGGQTISLKKRFRVATKNGILTNLAVIGKPLFLKIKGSSKKYPLNSHIQFNQAGEVIGGDFDEAMTFPLKFGFAKVMRFKVDLDGKALGEIFSHKAEKPMLESKLVLSPTDKDHKICASLGLVDSWVDTASTENIYVAGKQEFFDPKLGKVVSKIDESISIYKEVSCSGQVPLKL